MKGKTAKIITIVLSLIMVIALVGCGNNNDKGTEQNKTGNQTTNQTDTKKKDAGTLTVAIWDKNQAPGLRTMFDEFEKETGIKTEIQITPYKQYWTMLEAGATGNTLPDVFWMHSKAIAQYAEYQMLLDLTGRIEKSDKVEMGKFPQDLVELYKWEGKTQYAVPKDLDTIALWYNKTMFDEAGVEYPNSNWTWEDFRSACEKLTKKDGSQYGFAINPGNHQDGWYNVVYSMGGEILNEDKTKAGFDNPKTVKALEFVTNLVKDGLTPDYEVMTENTPTALFQSGKIAMVMEGSWMVPYLTSNDYVKANADLAVLPKDAETGRRVSIYNGLGWSAAANTDMPEEAWSLIEYMGSKEAQQRQADLGIVISAYENTEANWVNAKPDFNLKAHLDMMADMEMLPYSNKTLAWANMMVEKLVNAWAGTAEVKDVSNDINVEMNKILAEE